MVASITLDIVFFIQILVPLHSFGGSRLRNNMIGHSVLSVRRCGGNPGSREFRNSGGNDCLICIHNSIKRPVLNSNPGIIESIRLFTSWTSSFIAARIVLSHNQFMSAKFREILKYTASIRSSMDDTKLQKSGGNFILSED
ncbi:hypothetical protein AVEN_268098-1 [Araneus ventricosus]|uniref:Uncharacterized protein n=1 Tax=Araneus ventricosus TaxID=182803 RepID=A0A4Y2M8T9_ARAVE|nr:hypothetical protein AVEN_268098-1 [Araneus ventricosus]